MSKKTRKVSKTNFNIKKILLITFTIVFIASVLFTPTFKNLTGKATIQELTDSAIEMKNLACLHADLANDEKNDAKKYANRVEDATVISIAQDKANKVKSHADKAREHANKAKDYKTSAYNYFKQLENRNYYDKGIQAYLGARDCRDTADNKAKTAKKFEHQSKARVQMLIALSEGIAKNTANTMQAARLAALYAKQAKTEKADVSALAAVQAAIARIDEDASAIILLGPGESRTCNPLYELFNPSTNTHLYTTSESEKDTLTTSTGGFTFQGINGYLFEERELNTIPVFEFFTENTHIYTRDFVKIEQILLETPEFDYGGIVGYLFESEVQSTTELFRLFSLALGDYIYTIDETQKAYMLRTGYEEEGVEGFTFETEEECAGAEGISPQLTCSDHHGNQTACGEEAGCGYDTLGNTCFTQCTSNTPCSDPTSICDTTAGTCVECIEDSTCATTGERCDTISSSSTYQTCIPECTVATEATDCPGSKPVCDANTCVECTSVYSQKCIDDKTCYGNVCTEGCFSDNDCDTLAKPACDIIHRICVECTTATVDDDCAPDEVCYGNICVDCAGDADCTDPDTGCDANTNTCLATCTDDDDCTGALETCYYGLCVPGCFSSAGCSGSTPICDTITDNICVQCIVDSHCSDAIKTECNANNICIEATTCPSIKQKIDANIYCDASGNRKPVKELDERCTGNYQCPGDTCYAVTGTIKKCQHYATVNNIVCGMPSTGLTGNLLALYTALCGSP